MATSQKAVKKYQDENTKLISIRLNKKYDDDILQVLKEAELDGKSTASEIKRLIRIGIENDLVIQSLLFI